MSQKRASSSSHTDEVRRAAMVCTAVASMEHISFCVVETLTTDHPPETHSQTNLHTLWMCYPRVPVRLTDGTAYAKV